MSAMDNVIGIKVSSESTPRRFYQKKCKTKREGGEEAECFDIAIYRSQATVTAVEEYASHIKELIALRGR
jgi:hypothetical protein